MQTIGSYTIIGTLKEGPRPLYRAITAGDTGEERAIKVFPLDKVPEPSREPLRKELADAVALDHPHLVKAYEAGHEPGGGAGVLFLAMDLLDGLTLPEFIAKGQPLSWDHKLSLMDQICSAVEFLHTQNRVHGGIRPSRIFVERTGRIRVLGCGPVRGEISKSAHPAYLTPDQLLGEKYTPTSDVFALGLVFYELVTGQYAFAGTGNEAAKLTKAIVFQRPTTIKTLVPDVPAGLDMTIYKAIQKDANLRISDAGALRREIARAQPAAPAAGPRKLATLTKEQQAETILAPLPSAHRTERIAAVVPEAPVAPEAPVDPGKTVVMRPKRAGSAPAAEPLSNGAPAAAAPPPRREDIFCPSCTYRNPKGSRTCVKCGLPLGDFTTAGFGAAAAKPWYRNEAFIVAAVLVVMLLVALVWVWIKG